MSSSKHPQRNGSLTTILTTTLTTVARPTTPTTARKRSYRAWSRIPPAPGSVGVRGSSPLSSTQKIAVRARYFRAFDDNRVQIRYLLRERSEVVVDPGRAGVDVELVDVVVGADEVDVLAVIAEPVAVDGRGGGRWHGAG